MPGGRRGISVRSIPRISKLDLLVALARLGVGPAFFTCAGKVDGAGAQIHAIMSVQAFCSARRLNYAHTPLGQVEHLASRQDVEDWEAGFALGRGALSAASTGLPIVPIDTYVRSPTAWLSRAVVALPAAHGFADRHPESYGPIAARSRKALLGDALPPAGLGVDIAVHIRRGDVDATQPKRFTSNEAILCVIDAVCRACRVNGRDPRVTVHSEGAREQFGALGEYTMSLNRNALETLKSMASADLLIMAKSSFSYVAALLSRGLVVYEPFWHAPRKSWLTLGDLTALPGRIGLQGAGAALAGRSGGEG